MLVLRGFFVIFMVHSAICGNLNDEFTLGTSINKYLYSPKLTSDVIDEDVKKDEVVKSQLPVWFGPRFGKRSQISYDELPQEILEVFEKIEKSPELLKLIIEKFQQDSLESLYPLFPRVEQRSRPFTPRYGRDAADTNLHSRPYPPRFGRSSLRELPPYLPRLGRSAE